MVLGRITRGRQIDNLGGRHSIQTNQQSNSINPPHFYAGCRFCRNPSNLSWFGTGTGICWIAYPRGLVNSYMTIIFTAWGYAITVHLVLWPCVYLSICLSVTSQCSITMVKYSIMEIIPHNSLGMLVFCHERSWWNSNGVIPNGGAK